MESNPAAGASGGGAAGASAEERAGGRADGMVRLRGEAVVSGSARGAVLHADRPLSFWGGYDAASGRIIEPHHPLAGRRAAGGALVLPATRGSSTTTAVLLEAIRRETAPAALITRGVDSFLALACVVGQEMYGRSPALVAVGASEFEQLRDWPALTVEAGTLTRLPTP